MVTLPSSWYLKVMESTNAPECFIPDESAPFQVVEFVGGSFALQQTSQFGFRPEHKTPKMLEIWLYCPP